ncbi:hypothetical protein QQM79_18705 [Marinobacteraceae bacterium S3BR75-40.1]
MNPANTAQRFGQLVLDQLASHCAPPRTVERLVAQSCLRLLDSAIIIEDDFSPFSSPVQSGAAGEQSPLPQTDAIESVLENIGREGFAPHFHHLVNQFGSILVSLSANDSQLEKLGQWASKGASGCFLMTDRGGPSLQNWHTRVEKKDGEDHLSIDKVWGIEAHRDNFLFVAARKGNAFFPSLYLIDPDRARTLKRTKIGGPFLDGHLQLGNVSGSVPVAAEDQLTKGGLAGVTRLLTTIRPRFVRGIMQHLTWLEDQERLLRSASHTEIRHYIQSVAKSICEQTQIDRHLIDKVLALKFLSNEFLVQLVGDQQLPNLGDQRDALGFTKMEGSSYRCFFELYNKYRAHRA